MMKKLSTLLRNTGILKSLDGGVSLKNIEEFADFGVKGFVLGTSSIFGKKEDYQKILQPVVNKYE